MNFQWERRAHLPVNNNNSICSNNNNNEFFPIVGETKKKYLLTPEDIRQEIRVTIFPAKNLSEPGLALGNPVSSPAVVIEMCKFSNVNSKPPSLAI
jgi:hypothetical protein